MEDVCNAVKTALVTYLPEYLAQIATQEVPLPVLSDAGIVVGYIDLDAVKKAQCAFILPDIQTLEEETMSTQTFSSAVDVYIFVRSAKEETLYKQAMRYAAAVKKMFIDDYSIHGLIGQCTVRECEYFDEVEAQGNVIKAVRLGLTILTETEA